MASASATVTHADVPGEDTTLSITSSVSSQDDGGRARANVSLFFVPEGQMDSFTVTTGEPGGDFATATATVNEDGSGLVETRAEVREADGSPQSISQSRVRWNAAGETTEDTTLVQTFDGEGNLLTVTETALDPNTGVTTQTTHTMAEDGAGGQTVGETTVRTRTADTPEGQWDSEINTTYNPDGSVAAQTELNYTTGEITETAFTYTPASTTGNAPTVSSTSVREGVMGPEGADPQFLTEVTTNYNASGYPSDAQVTDLTTGQPISRATFTYEALPADDPVAPNGLRQVSTLETFGPDGFTPSEQIENILDENGQLVQSTSLPISAGTVTGQGEDDPLAVHRQTLAEVPPGTELQDYTPEQIEAYNALHRAYMETHGEDVLMHHHEWHRQNGAGGTRGPGSGEDFLEMHRRMITDFESFVNEGIPNGDWTVPQLDPTRPLPENLGQPSEIGEGFEDRRSNDPNTQRPAFLTVGGNSEAPFMLDGRAHHSLEDFESLDDLGRALGTQYHGSVHVNLGGSMGNFDSPMDPTFYAWHGEVDGVVSEWLQTENGQAWAADNPEQAALWGVTSNSD